MGGKGSGRIAQPRALKLLSGRGPGVDSAGRRVPSPPRFRREAPEPPDDLTEFELTLWTRVVDDLEPLGLLKRSDWGILWLYVKTFSQVLAAKRLVDKAMLIKNPDSGVVHRNPAVSILAEARRDLIRIGAELGLSPAAENHLASDLLSSNNSDDNPAGYNPFAGPPPWKRASDDV
jgi:P27 family predicted phage terminase small subunit